MRRRTADIAEAMPAVGRREDEPRSEQGGGLPLRREGRIPQSADGTGTGVDKRGRFISDPGSRPFGPPGTRRRGFRLANGLPVRRRSAFLRAASVPKALFVVGGGRCRKTQKKRGCFECLRVAEDGEPQSEVSPAKRALLRCPRSHGLHGPEEPRPGIGRDAERLCVLYEDERRSAEAGGRKR